MKLAVIGGGSTYTPELLNGLLDPKSLSPISQIVLHDIAAQRLDPVAAFCRRFADHRGSNVQITTTQDLTQALHQADFVVTQIRVGGQLGRHEDIMMGLRYGLIGQETTGVGGMAKALRTVPAMLKIAEEAKKICPNAWILNFTNPSGIVTEALQRQGHHRVIGLCNVPIELHIDIAEVLQATLDEVKLDWTGLNHLGWVRKVVYKEQNVLPKLIEKIETQQDQQNFSGPANLPEISYPPKFLSALGMIPSSYVRFFYAPEKMLASIRANPRTRAQEVLDIEKQLFKLYRDPKQVELPDLLSQRGGAWYSRLAVNVIKALLNDKPSIHIVNTTNYGAIKELSESAVVEIPCEISSTGVKPLPQNKIPDEIIGLITQVKAYERLTIDAIIQQNQKKAFLALLANPLVPNAETASLVLSSMIQRKLI